MSPCKCRIFRGYQAFFRFLQWELCPLRHLLGQMRGLCLWRAERVWICCSRICSHGNARGISTRNGRPVWPMYFLWNVGHLSWYTPFMSYLFRFSKSNITCTYTNTAQCTTNGHSYKDYRQLREIYNGWIQTDQLNTCKSYSISWLAANQLASQEGLCTME